MYDIVNVLRPMSESPEKILKLKESMEGFARLPVSGFINNSNLQTMSSAEDLRRGYEVLRETSVLSGLPVAYTTGQRSYLEEFLSEGRDMQYVGKALPLELYMGRSWDNLAIGRI